ncbi:MAG: hypothetical protein ATN31_09450 [Candidatus Epulonipiscioides saccharophilum]|nr:MAG: hypothetical protein ATN31_09450 [Epulopiscium sp. AS2M-Bin001]
MLKKLQYYSNKIEELEQKYGLSFYPQEFELINKPDMLAYMAYEGFINHYPHWSFGKMYDKLKYLGESFEIVINNNPCVAYLLASNSLLTQIMTIAHVFAHNDFFKNNARFANSTSDALTMFSSHNNRIRSLIKLHGYKAVEHILDIAHSLKFYSHENSILDFIIKNSYIPDWHKTILEIVMLQSRYLQPQLETKIINEGWATFWHYKILHDLNLPSDLHFEFLILHNKIIAPTSENSINPYLLGFNIWSDIFQNCNINKMLSIRSQCDDNLFIKNYLTPELIKKINLFITHDKNNHLQNYADYTKVQIILLNNIALNNVPKIHIIEYNNHSFILSHLYDGRDLDLFYTTQTLKYIQTLLHRSVILFTNFSGVNRKIICDIETKIHIENC